MYHVMGKKDHVKSRHAMCRRYEDWGEDPYWEEVYARIAGFIASKPGTDGLVGGSLASVGKPPVSQRSDTGLLMVRMTDGQSRRVVSTTVL